MPDSIAPWTDDEVRSLNDYQASGLMHPFACGNDSSHLVLRATAEGWECPCCDYRQGWAHVWMANWGWRIALETGLGAWVPGSVVYDSHAQRPARYPAGGSGV